MKKLMGFNFPGDFNLTNSPIRLESNQQIITDLSDLVSSSPLDNDNLLLFVELLVNRFDWIGADLEDIDKCKNVVLDLVSLDGSCVDWLVKRLITNFKSSNKKHLKVDLCSREFESIHELKKHVRTILTTSKDDEELKGDNHKLLYELLGYHSSVQLKERVVAIFPSTHKNPAFKGLRCFFYRDKTGSVDFFSYARCCDNVKTRGQILREHLCDLLVDICKLSPTTLGSISDTLDILYPHHNVQIEHHISFTKAMLYIANRLPMIRTSLYRILINKLTVIDSEIRLADPNVVDVEKVENLRSEKLKELANQLLKGESSSTQFKKLQDPNWFRDIYDKLRTEEDCDDMSQKLDFLMALVFEDLHLLLNMCSKYTSASINNTNSTGISNPKNNLQQQPMQINGTLKSKNPQDNFLGTLDTQSGTSQHNIAQNVDECVSKMEMDKYEIMYTPKNKIEMVKGMSSETCYASSDSSFSDTNSAETLSLDSSGSFSSQIITNCESSSSLPNSLTTDNKTSLLTNEQKCDAKLTVEKVVKELFEVFEQVILQAYKCKYVQFIYFFIASFDVEWLRMFLQRLFGIVYDNSQHVIKRRTAASYISSLICRAKYVPQNFITSTLTHFFALLSPFNQFISNNGDSNKTSSSVNGILTNGKVVTKKLSLFYSILQDILYIICYHTDVISRSESCVSFIENTEAGLMAYLTSYLDPLAYCKRSVISEAIKSTSYYSNLACLHKFLKSKSHLLDNSKESEQFKWSFYSPIDSFFPFDPYLLHHSRFYISDKYNSKPHVPESAALEDRAGVDSAVTTQQNEVVDEVVDAIKSDKNLVEDDLKRMSRCLDDSLGFSSISRALKAKLDTLKRNFSADTNQIEADYDFWNYENTIKLLEDTDNPATVPLDQDEMRLCEELGIEVMEDRKHGLLELLTSSSAYKSAIINSKRAKLCQTN